MLGNILDKKQAYASIIISILKIDTKRKNKNEFSTTVFHRYNYVCQFECSVWCAAARYQR